MSTWCMFYALINVLLFLWKIVKWIILIVGKKYLEKYEIPGKSDTDYPTLQYYVIFAVDE